MIDILFIIIKCKLNDVISRRSSDSAKYTNKSSGTSVLSGNFNTSSFHTQFYSGNKHRENDRQSHGSINIATAPVHRKVVANMAHNDSNNHIINRFINNNNTQSYNNHYSLSLNRHAENHNAKLGVGCISTLTSPYAGSGVERVRGTKSDIGNPLEPSRLGRMHRNGVHKSSVLHKSNLASVHSDLSISEATFKDPHFHMNDIINNNNNSPTTSAITFSKTGSKLLYSNKHRISTLTYDNAPPRHLLNDANANKLGPLLYKNDGEPGSWKNSVYDNPIRSVS